MDIQLKDKCAFKPKLVYERGGYRVQPYGKYRMLSPLEQSRVTFAYQLLGILNANRKPTFLAPN